MYTAFAKLGEGKYASSTMTQVKRLESGVYKVAYSEMGDVTVFSKQYTNYDKLIDLPGTAYDKVVTEINTFLESATKALFDKFGFLYKRSFLLHGKPGGGKTCIVNRVSEKVISAGGLVFLVDNPSHLAEAFKVMNELDPGRLILVILEELDTLLARHEKNLLLLLDGEIQMNNIIYIATTNYLDKVPQRILRPGRFSSIVSVGWPNSQARKVYLSTKFDDANVVDEWAAATHGLSIDEIKETVLAVCCLKQDRTATINKILSIKKSTGDYDEYEMRNPGAELVEEWQNQDRINNEAQSAIALEALKKMGSLDGGSL